MDVVTPPSMNFCHIDEKFEQTGWPYSGKYRYADSETDNERLHNTLIHLP